jgi:predicted lipid-binding transport protein (Tim44 family)
MKALLAFGLTLCAVMLITLSDAEARRFGGKMTLGKQYKSAPRTMPYQSQQSTAARSQAATSAAGRTSGVSRWLGPLAGLAAGGLLASLLFGDAFDGLQIMDILLIGGLLFGALMLVKTMRRGSPALAGTGPVSGGRGSLPGMIPPDIGKSAQGAPAPGDDEAPTWFDGPGFVEGAKTHFIRLQAAWDQADFRDIREYTTSQLFAELKRERDRLGEEAQHTEVVTLDAEIIGIRRDGDQVVASILFSGLIREERDATAEPFREIWHVQHDWESSEGDWLIAGVQQVSEHENG